MIPPARRGANGLPWVRMRLLAAFACAMAMSAAAFAQAAAGRAGWDAIREGRNEDAAVAFADALRAEPRNPSLYLGAGLAAQLLGDTAKARESFEQALKLAPHFTPASIVLGDLLYKHSDLQGAIAVYEAARRYAPDDKTLLARLAHLRDEPSPEKGVFQSQSAHFTVLFEGPADDELARRAVDVLESAYWRLDQKPGELERVLTHELTHAMIRAIAPRGVPTWLNEGLAVLFEPDGTEWAATTLSGSTERIPLDELAGGFDNLTGNQARTAYAESADAARRLFDEIGGAGVVALLQDIARGVPLADAFQRRTLTPYSAFAASMR